MKSVRKDLNLMNKLGWKIKKHITFADNQHNYIFTDTENSCHIVWWCKGGKIMEHTFYDAPFVE